jgi:hypothetical protein
MIAKHILRAVHEIGLMAGISIMWTANVSGQTIQTPIGTLLPDLPQVESPFELRAINDPAAELEHGDPSSVVLKSVVQLAPYGCGAATGEATRVFTVNGVVRPKIAIAPGEKQFWRIVNASPDLYAYLEGHMSKPYTGHCLIVCEIS